MYSNKSLRVAESMFTKVLTNEAPLEIQEKPMPDIYLKERISILIGNPMEMLTCVKTTYSRTDTDKCRQRECLAMSSPLSPILVSIYVEYFEDLNIW